MYQSAPNPLSSRYASRQMSELFSDDNRYSLWRRLWLTLAECQQKMGLGISNEQIKQLRENLSNIDYEVVKKRESEVRHDVMAHIYAFGIAAPLAAPIIHLGATSCYVTDNAEIIIIRDALNIIKGKLVALMQRLGDFCLAHKDVPCLGYTHLQPAQATTVGKRASLWLSDIMMDFNALTALDKQVVLRGLKGTTGTQASFFELLGSEERVYQLEELVVKSLGFESAFDVTGQTYPRKLDYYILNALASVAVSASKFAFDIRLLQSFGEIEEPFEKNQIGSSAMAYKRNPMRSERICSLSRYAVSLPHNAADTAATQLFERTLDDSANRRIVLTQAFLAVDAVLNLYLDIACGLVVNKRVIERRLNNQLPFMTTEKILMSAVKAGGDRQALHERIRVHSLLSANAVKEDGLENDLLSRLRTDPMFENADIPSVINPSDYIGLADKQTERFVNGKIVPLINKNKALLKNIVIAKIES